MSQIVTWCPFMVALKQNVSGSLKLCGGTILTHTLILTAGHCLLFGTKDLQLKFGSINLFRGSVFKATRIILHAQFDPTTFVHDLGLVSIFPAYINYGYDIQPVPLPKHDVSLDPDARLTIYGWGAISEHNSFSETLRSAELPVVNIEICQFLLDSVVPDKSFCLGYFDGHVDACIGDSGGPAMLDGIQVGITSFGEGCALPLKPGVYTDLTKHLHWLHAAIDTFL